MNDLLSALGAVGDTVDKFTGGRALRGTLAGKPRELLSVLPFSDSIGLTDAHDTTSGRDLTDAYGLTNKGDDSFGSHAAGFVADTVLSPGSLLGGYGAFKAAPTIAKGVAAGAKSLSGLDLLDQLSGLGRSASRSFHVPTTLKRFANDESGALNLKFDNWNEPPKGMPRTDPEWLNNKTFYHGSATPGLTTDSLNPMATSTRNMYGRGIYTTSSEDVGRSYLQKAVNDMNAGVANANAVPSLYQSQSKFNNVLDLDRPVHPAIYQDLYDSFRNHAAKSGISKRDFAEMFKYGKPVKSRNETPVPLDELFRSMQQYILPNARKGSDPLLSALRYHGYDALTHTGGNIIGGGKVHHQVVVGLDPNDFLRTGSASPYQQWTPLQ
jgi:hypothetical protein